jgi:uncharacterized protein YegP (UPF0339 family)
MHIEIFTQRRLLGRLEWRWRAVASNGRKIAGSLEGYRNLADLHRAIRLLRDGFPNADIKIRI